MEGVGNPPELISAGLPHPLQGRSIRFVVGRVGEPPELVERAGDKGENKLGPVIPGARLALKAVQPPPELGWPVDLHPGDMAGTPQQPAALSAAGPAARAKAQGPPSALGACCLATKPGGRVPSEKNCQFPMLGFPTPLRFF
jgi:hypothetical protein